MIPPSLQLAIGCALIGLIGGASCAWYWTASYKDASWSASIDKLNIQAEQTLREEIEKVHKIEKDQAVKIEAMEAAHESQLQEIERAKVANRTLATQLGGLRDPGRRPRSQGTVPCPANGSRESTDESASARLSEEASAFLLEFAHEADRAALYAVQCQAFIGELGLLPAPTE